jgi:nucleoid-associated protein YgaU
MPLPFQPKLQKLTIEAFTTIERTIRLSGPHGNQLVVQFNPESLSTTHANELQKQPAITSVPAASSFANQKPGTLDVKLVFDGTDVGRDGGPGGARGPTVAQMVAQFFTLCLTVYSDSHEPPFLTLTWGSGRIFGPRGFKCRLGTVTTTYTAFNRDGTPLRAEVDAHFVAAISPEESLSEHHLNSPDVTHHRLVRSGDTLPGLCREIYGSAGHYLRVAAVNGLDDLRALVPGTELVFPPYDRKEQR